MRIIAHCARPRRSATIDRRAALATALASGADRVELDVVCVRGRLLVAHDEPEAMRLDLEPAGTDVPPFADLLASIAAAGRDLLADIKGQEAAAALDAALATAQLGSRTIVSGDLGLLGLAAARSGAARAWTLPSSDSSFVRAHQGPLGLATRAARERVRRAAALATEARRCEGVSVDCRFITAALIRDAHRAGGFVIAWTVDRRSQLRRLAQLGVDEVVTNDPAAARRALAGG